MSRLKSIFAAAASAANKPVPGNNTTKSSSVTSERIMGRAGGTERRAGRWATQRTTQLAPAVFRIAERDGKCFVAVRGTRLAFPKGMEWLTWFPSVRWQHTAFALALVLTGIAILIAVRPRGRGRRPRTIQA